jgi:hypothetical protein
MRFLCGDVDPAAALPDEVPDPVRIEAAIGEQQRLGLSLDRLQFFILDGFAGGA